MEVLRRGDGILYYVSSKPWGSCYYGTSSLLVSFNLPKGSDDVVTNKVFFTSGLYPEEDIVLVKLIL